LWESGHLAGEAKMAAYRSHLCNRILPVFGHVHLSKINRHAVKMFVVQLRRSLADSSVASVMPLGRRSGWVRTDGSGLEAPVKPQ
jgi:hypothetical protein